MRKAILVFLTLVLFSAFIQARGSRGYRSHSIPYHPPKTGTSIKSNHQSKRAADVPRDSHGRIKRDPKARKAFMKSNPCPSTGKTSGACPGYVVDHVKPLKRGGADAPSNMQWQTQAAAKAKDKWE